MTKIITDKAAEWLEARGLDLDQMARHGIYSCSGPDGEPTRNENADWIAIPFTMDDEIVAIKTRKLSEKDFGQRKGGKQILWNRECLNDPSLKDYPLIITEGELDALAAVQSGFPKTVSVPGGAPAEANTKKHAYFDEAWHKLKDCETIILATDCDDKGDNLAADIIARFGKARCKVITYPKRSATDSSRCKDLNEVLQVYGEAGVAQTLNQARYVRVNGVYDLTDVPESPPVKPVRLRGMGQDFYRHVGLCKGQVSVWTGYANRGKSAMLRNVMLGLARERGWRIGAATFEDETSSAFLPEMRRMFIGKDLLAPDEIERANEFLGDKFRFIIPPDDVSPTLPWFMDMAETCVRRHGCDFILMDPWTELDLQIPNGASETEITKNYLTHCIRFAKVFNVHFAIVAHPKKPPEYGGGRKMPDGYDISGSAHWRNKPYLGVTVQSDDETPGLSQVWVWKSKYREIMGPTGKFYLKFNTQSRSFSECSKAEAIMMQGHDSEEAA